MERGTVSKRQHDDAVEHQETEVDVTRVREAGPAGPAPVPPDAVPAEGMVVEEGGTRVITEDERIRTRPDGTIERQVDRREHEPPRRRIGGGWGVPAAFLALLIAILAAIAVVWYLQAESDAEVPTVVGLPAEDAVARLDEEGLTANLTGGPSDRPEGTVFAQDPEAGSVVPDGTRVDVTVSEGPDEVTVPNAIGLEEAAARDRLAELGLDVRVVDVFSEEPQGTVVAQDPAAGEEVEPESSVRLNVSQGSGTVVVPSLVGEQRDAAEQQLRDLQLRANVIAVPSDEPEGTVIAQNPTSGEVRVGSTVRLNVSSGR